MRKVIIALLLICGFNAVNAQHLKTGAGHQNNPYYSNTDIKKREFGIRNKNEGINSYI